MKHRNRHGRNTDGHQKNPSPTDVRCRCNRLMAKMADCKLEFVCPRCKRKIVLDLSGIADDQEILNRITFVA